MSWLRIQSVAGEALREYSSGPCIWSKDVLSAKITYINALENGCSWLERWSHRTEEGGSTELQKLPIDYVSYFPLGIQN